MSGTEVRLSGIHLPYSKSWLYRIYRDTDTFDSFTSSVKLTAQQMLDVESGYRESLDGYVLGGVDLDVQEIPRQQAKRVRMTRAAEDQS